MAVSRSTVERESADDTIPHTKRPGGKVSVAGSDIVSHGLNDRQKLAIDDQQTGDDMMHATMR